MSSDQRVNVIVVHYADPIQTESCVRHLRAQHPAVVEDIQVIDNSVGRDAEELRRLLPSESICETGRNLGFADGVNVGMTRVCASDPDFVWVVTPDAMPDPQCLRVLLQAMVADSELGICGPVIDADGELIVGCRLVEALGFLVRINTIAPEALETLPKVLPTDFVEGCSMLIRTDAARAIGPFRLEFFLYYEECEFCLRARDLGWKLAVAREARVVTRARRSERNRRQYYLTRNAILLARVRRKHLAAAVIRGLVETALLGALHGAAMSEGIKAVRDGLRVSLPDR